MTLSTRYGKHLRRINEAVAQDPTLQPADLILAWTGWTFLQWEAAIDRVDEARRLLQAGVDVEARGADGSTALGVAIQHGSTKMVVFLLEHGADVKYKGPGGQDALTLAADSNDLPIVRLLLSHVGNEAALQWVKESDAMGRTALHYAVWMGNSEMVRELLIVGADPTITLNDDLHLSPWEVANLFNKTGCIMMIEWFSKEKERHYHLHKARMVLEDTTFMHLYPTTFKPPVYLRSRFVGLPSVQGVPLPSWPGQEAQDEEVEETLCFVMNNMNKDLYGELMEGLDERWEKPPLEGACSRWSRGRGGFFNFNR